MSLATAELPDDMVSLRAFALACQSELKVAELSVQYKALEIEKLKLQIAKLDQLTAAVIAGRYGFGAQWLANGGSFECPA